MKRLISILLIFTAFTTLQAQGFEYGLKAGLNFNSSADLDNISLDLLSIDEAKNAVNGFNIGVYGQIKLAMLYVRSAIHFSKFETSFDELTIGKSRLEAPSRKGWLNQTFSAKYTGPYPSHAGLRVGEARLGRPQTVPSERVKLRSTMSNVRRASRSRRA